MASDAQYEALFEPGLDLEEEAQGVEERARGVEETPSETPSQEVTMKELWRAADADSPSPEAEAAAGDEARESAPAAPGVEPAAKPLPACASDTSAPATPPAAPAATRSLEPTAAEAAAGGEANDKGSGEASEASEAKKASEASGEMTAANFEKAYASMPEPFCHQLATSAFQPSMGGSRERACVEVEEQVLDVILAHGHTPPGVADDGLVWIFADQIERQQPEEASKKRVSRARSAAPTATTTPTTPLRILKRDDVLRLGQGRLDFRAVALMHVHSENQGAMSRFAKQDPLAPPRPAATTSHPIRDLAQY